MRTAVLIAACLVTACSPDFDIILEGGTVVDGTGALGYRADVAMRGSQIAAVGNLEDVSARTRIDVSGLVVAPGFIDVHSHAAPALETEELSHGEPLLRQGITTIFANPDGGGRVHLEQQARDLEAAVPGVNVALLVPHGAVRREVMGMENRPSTEAELRSMQELVAEGKEAGAFGLSSGLFYTPGSFAGLSEVIELARVFGPGGVYISHIRDESDYSIGLLAAIDEVIEVARLSGTTGVVTHIKALGPHVWRYSAAAIARINAARAEGVDVWADQYPYEASATGLTALVSRPLLAGGIDSFRVRLRNNPEQIRADVAGNLERRGGPERIQFRRFRHDPSIEGRTLAEVAAGEGDPVQTALDLIDQGSAGIVSHNMLAEDVEAFMAQPWVMTSSDGGLVAMGDGVPHPRNYGSFPRKLALYVRERGVIELEAAVRSMTGLPADVMKLEGRGYVREGYVADLVVFDPDRIQDRATYTEPHQLSEGVEYLFLSGEPAVHDAKLTAERLGQVLRRIP